MSGYNIELRNVIDSPWLSTTRIPVGQIPHAQATPELYVLVEKAGAPHLRIDLYADGEQARYFQEAIIWLSWVVIGYGSSVHFISIHDGTAKTFGLNDYFSNLYPSADFLLVASGSGLIRFDEDAQIVWHNDSLGIDGVIVHGVSNGIISGEGEWDPPGGWKSFQIGLERGKSV
jgi:hypothetical protein